MKLAISNLAWETVQDQQISDLLQAHGVSAIDVATGKYFQNIAHTNAREVEAVRRWWNDRGIEIIGMQALLYGTSGLNVFGDADVQQKLLSHLDAVCRVGKTLGATRLVFGSPRNRDRSSLSEEITRAVATSFFHRLGDIAAGHGVNICLEPNPSCYGANFMTNSLETAAVVRSVAHPAIQMQFDTGSLTINGEDANQTLQQCAKLVGHIHLSEPNLLPLGDTDTNHAAIAETLIRHLPSHVATIEMLATVGEAHEISITRALRTALRYYSGRT